MNRLRRVPVLCPVFDHYRGINSAAYVEFRGQAGEARIQSGHQILENPIGHVFVKGTFISIGSDVEFQRFEFHATQVGNVFEVECSKIGLPGHRTQAGKLGHPDANGIIPLRIGVGKGFERSTGLGQRKLPLLVGWPD